MDNRFTEVLETYDFDIHNISRTRGAFLLDTSRGRKLLKCLEGTEKKLLFENEITAYLSYHGFENVDSLVRNKEGELFTRDGQGERYIVKNWFQGEGFDPKDKVRTVEAAGILGRLHQVLGEMPVNEELARAEPIVGSLEKHTREMKRVRTYIRSKKQKNELEAAIMENYPLFYDKAVAALDMLAKLDYAENKVMHGSYTYHNVLFDNKKSAVVNFDKAGVGFQITDLYYFLRKTMEKNNWSVSLGSSMIEEYQRFSPIGAKQWKLLKLLLIYPEKYWKITNHYYNSKKCWIAGRSIEKLEAVCRQEAQKTKFLQEVFSLSF